MPTLPPPDRAAIADPPAPYCFALDLHDFEDMREVFTPDAVITYSGPRVSTGIDEIITFFRVATSTVDATQHLLHTSRIWSDGPDAAHGLTHVTALHTAHDVPLPAPASATYTVTGTYTDDFSRTPAGWRIARRTLRLVTQTGDPTILRPVTQDR